MGESQWITGKGERVVKHWSKFPRAVVRALEPARVLGAFGQHSQT